MIHCLIFQSNRTTAASPRSTIWTNSCQVTVHVSCQESARGCVSACNAVPHTTSETSGSNFGHISIGRDTKWFCLSSVVVYQWISVEHLHELCLFEESDDLFLECTVCLFGWQVNSLEHFILAVKWQLRQCEKFFVQDSSLLGCYAMLTGKYFLRLGRSILPQFRWAPQPCAL